LKKALLIIGSLFGLLIVALLVVPVLIPVETYKTELLTQIEKATGRKARIDGDFSFSLLPRVEFTAGKVSLANAPGATAPMMMGLDRVDIRVAVMPLLSGNVVIDSFVLEKPLINLEIDRQGRPNWELTPAVAASNTASPAGQKSGGERSMNLAGLSLGDVRLVDGKVMYSDARNGTRHVVDSINISILLPSFTKPLKADGSLVWKDEKISVDLRMEKPDAFLNGESTDLASAISSDLFKLDFKGKAARGKEIKASGALDLDVPSVRKLAAWAGSPLTVPGPGLQKLKITGQVGIDGQKYQFAEAELTLDKLAAKGDFRFDGGGKRPKLNARLDTGLLDVNPYLPASTRVREKATASSPRGGSAAAPDGWSDEQIDLSGLRLADMDAVLKVAGLHIRKIRIGKSQLKIALTNGRLVADLTEMALYDGNGKAKITADATVQSPVFAAALDLSGLKAKPALSDAMDLDRIEGALNTNVDVKTRGKSQREMISALSGSGRVKFIDGAVRGINIGAMVRNVRSAFLDPAAREQQKTDFAEMSGTFKIANGILRNDDLFLLSPLLRVSGRGDVNLPQRTINYRIEPKVAATSKGQGGKTNVSGVMVPVIVSGPWSALSYRPDIGGVIEGIAKDPSKALDGLKKVIPDLKTRDGSSGNSVNPADAIKKLFGR
jgi:AsmA protein